jgi:serine-type D-Ala-D-Ala carboxypeptidase (penicillin-binding protein 5/6)
MKIKKVAAAVLAVLLLISPSAVAADTGTAQQPTQPAVVVKAKSAILVEASTGKVLYENNDHEKLYPASITKIMTELLVLEALEAGKIKWDDKITASAHAASMGGSDIWLKQGEVMSVTDLFKAMAVNSANDAAVALGEIVAGSEPAFVNLMNDKAKKLGMNDTHFSNCTGLDADDNYSSAYDVMLMSKELITHKDIFNYSTIWMDSLRDGKTGLYNTNKLIRFYNGANGLKTGSTSKAGYCLSATALRGGMQLIAVVMDCTTEDDRFSSASNLLDYGFANWACVTPKLTSPSVNVKVLRGDRDEVKAVADPVPTILTQKGKEGGITQKITCAQNVMAPVVKGQVVGQITFWADGQNVGSVLLRSSEAVGKLSFFRAFGRLFVGMAGS